MSATPQCFGALALELAAPPERAVLARADAETLVTHAANDLLRLLPEVQSLDLALAGAHFDPAELLRPGWPRHAALIELLRRAPGVRGARVIGFGAHAGSMPLAELTPDPALFGGPLRLLPFVLDGEAEQVADISQAMEARLLDTGMAGAATALFAQDAFGAQIEHARYLSLHDLCAMTAMQYEHAGLAPLWPVIETALFAPHEEVWLDAPPEPLLRYAAGTAGLIEPDPAQGAVAARARQFAAVLRAHAIDLRELRVATGTDARTTLSGW